MYSKHRFKRSNGSLMMWAKHGANHCFRLTRRGTCFRANLGREGKAHILLPAPEGRELRIILHVAPRDTSTARCAGLRWQAHGSRGPRCFAPADLLLRPSLIRRSRAPWRWCRRTFHSFVSVSQLLYDSRRRRLLQRRGFLGRLSLQRRLSLGRRLTLRSFQIMDPAKKPLLLLSELRLLPQFCLQLGAESLHLFCSYSHLCLQLLFL
mmetsp:Transcript_119438/g.283534  ORF Transcript_119438/g.283534 Transcript_119438/m.283534 type:complete len:208 (-) Transcript_119438:774-1397(-)